MHCKTVSILLRIRVRGDFVMSIVVRIMNLIMSHWTILFGQVSEHKDALANFASFKYCLILKYKDKLCSVFLKQQKCCFFA